MQMNNITIEREKKKNDDDEEERQGKAETKKSQLSFINILACNAHHYSETTAGNIDINALNDDKFFPVVLVFFCLSVSLFLSSHCY